MATLLCLHPPGFACISVSPLVAVGSLYEAGGQGKALRGGGVGQMQLRLKFPLLL